MKIIRCRVCSAANLEVFLDLGPQPHGDALLVEDELESQEPAYPLEACFCQSCSTVQINYTVPKEQMFANYLYVSGTTRTLRNHFQSRTKYLIKRLPLSKGNFVVDIGSNDGTWLESYIGTGIKTLGIDGAKNLAEIANKKGIETWPLFFDEKVAEQILSIFGNADLVTAAGVFFHLEELHSVTAGVSRLLGDSGTFCVQAIYLGSMIRDNKFDQIYHEHLTYWSLTTLKRLLERYDLEVYDVEFIPIHGGSLEVLAAHKNVKTVTEKVQRLLREEEQLGLNEISSYYDFANRVWAIKAELIDILENLQKQNRKVAALGAPIKGSTLLNSFKIGRQLVNYAIEINPLKIDKYIPGVRIPIFNEKTAVIPDVYLALAWNFLPELIDKNVEFLLNGGQILVPFPKPFFVSKFNYLNFIQS
jgi:hypothetical protein